MVILLDMWVKETDEEEVMGKLGVQDRNTAGQIVMDFVKRKEIAVVKRFLQKSES